MKIHECKYSSKVIFIINNMPSTNKYYYHILHAKWLCAITKWPPFWDFLLLTTLTLYFYLVFIVFFPLPFTPLTPPPPSNHHTVVHVHESFFLFSSIPLPLTSHPSTSCHPALWVCPHFPCCVFIHCVPQILFIL